MQLENKDNEKIQNIKKDVESIYDKYKDDINKLDLIEKELNEIRNFILSKKEYIKYETILRNIKNKK